MLYKISILVICLVFASVLAQTINPDFPIRIGGLRPVEPNQISDADASMLVQSANKTYNAQSNSENTFKATDVLSVTKQVVAGIKYDYTVRMVETDCNRALMTNPMIRLPTHRFICSAIPNGQQQVCRFVIVIQPWLKGDEFNNAELKSCDSMQ